MWYDCLQPCAKQIPNSQPEKAPKLYMKNNLNYDTNGIIYVQNKTKET